MHAIFRHTKLSTEDINLAKEGKKVKSQPTLDEGIHYVYDMGDFWNKTNRNRNCGSNRNRIDEPEPVRTGADRNRTEPNRGLPVRNRLCWVSKRKRNRKNKETLGTTQEHLQREVFLTRQYSCLSCFLFFCFMF